VIVAGIKPARKTQGIDLSLLLIIVVLTMVGMATVYSAGSERSLTLYGSQHKMFLNQFLRAIIGFGMLLVTANIPYRFWKKMAYPALAFSIVLLLLLLIDGVGETSKGATRWLRFGPIRFQPSEIARYSSVIFIAYWAYTRGELMEKIETGLLIPLGITGAMAGMILLQPDFSTAAMLIATVLVLLFLAGVKFVHMLMVLSPMAVIGFVAIWFSDYKRERLMTFLTPGNDPSDSGYQILQSWIGLGRGGMFGVGLGGSRQKLFFLPDAHTDFIFSIVGEEWGLFGTTVMLGLFLFLVLRGFRIAARCPDPFGSYLAAGITFSVGIYAFVNMAITVGLLPPTGLPLPMISYGGTSLMMTLAAIGIVLNISRYQSAKRLTGNE